MQPASVSARCIYLFLLRRKCKYTGECKYLVELEDTVDDEMLLRLKLEEELSAINGDGLGDGFAFNLHEAAGIEAPLEEDPKVKLTEFPEVIEDQLGLRIKKYKDAAIKRKGSFKTTEDRLMTEGSTGHEHLD